jgi:hypothetical protein
MLNVRIAGLVTKPEPYTLLIRCRGSAFERTIRNSLGEARTDALPLSELDLDIDIGGSSY